MNTKKLGFSLFELMVAVAISAILAAVAYPSYSAAMVKGRRAAVQTVLSDVAQRQQQYLTDNRAYAASLTDLSLTVEPDVVRYYTVTLIVSSLPPAFTVTAAPRGGTSQSGDGTLKLTHIGLREPAGKW